MKKNAGPIIAAVLLLLPVVYVGSYLALVPPRGTVAVDGFGLVRIFRYRCGRDLAEAAYWPLEQIDRRLRPEAWRMRRRRSAINEFRIPLEDDEPPVIKSLRSS